MNSQTTPSAPLGPSALSKETRTVAYRTLAGDWWDAAVEHEHSNGRIDIVVDDLRLTQIAVFHGDRSACPKGVAWGGA